MARPAGKFAPTSGCLLGAHVNLVGDAAQGPDLQNGITLRETQLGTKLTLVATFYPWSGDWTWPQEIDAWAAGRGMVPLIAWDSVSPTLIANGSQDPVITAAAARAKAFAKPIILRWGAEMNGIWAEFNASRYGQDASVYVTAWRRIVDRFRAEQVTNVAFCWCPNNTDEPREAWNHWTNYYPGDAYVDWVGIDGYNWGGARWESPEQVLGPIYHDYGDRKPILIGETSSVESGGAKEAWIAAFAAWVRANPSVAAVCWFDTNKEHDWRIDSTPAAMAAFKKLAADPYFKAVPGGSVPTPPPAPTPPAPTPPAPPAPTPPKPPAGPKVREVLVAVDRYLHRTPTIKPNESDAAVWARLRTKLVR